MINCTLFFIFIIRFLIVLKYIQLPSYCMIKTRFSSHLKEMLQSFISCQSNRLATLFKNCETTSKLDLSILLINFTQILRCLCKFQRQFIINLDFLPALTIWLLIIYIKLSQLSDMDLNPPTQSFGRKGYLTNELHVFLWLCIRICDFNFNIFMCFIL